MAYEYKPSGLYVAQVDPDRCKASVWDRFRDHQCQRRPWKDGWCKQHHPEMEAKRKSDRMAAWEAKRQREREQNPWGQLAKAREEIETLRARIAELEAKA